MAKDTVKANKAKKWFIISLIAWLIALPLLILLQTIVRFTLTESTSDGPETIQAFINIVSLLLGFFSFLGWIPTLVFLIVWQSKK